MLSRMWGRGIPTLLAGLLINTTTVESYLTVRGEVKDSYVI